MGHMEGFDGSSYRAVCSFVRCILLADLIANTTNTINIPRVTGKAHWRENITSYKTKIVPMEVDECP